MKPIVFLAIVIAANAALFLDAQQPVLQPAGQQQSLKGVELKKLAPVSSDVLQVRLLRPVERRLKNGARVLILENHRVPTVNIDLVLSASTLNDPAGLPGVAEGTAYMLKQGTKTRNSRQIADQLSELGASVNVAAEYGARSTHIYASALTENLDAMLDIFGDILLNPTFPQDELDKWKTRQRSRLEQQRTSEYYLGSERLHLVLYPGDARQVTSPTRESLDKLSRQNLIDYHKSFYRPGSSLLGVAGDITTGSMLSKLEKLLAAWESGTVSDPKLPFEPALPEKKIYLVDRPNSVQTYLTLANRAIDRMHPDYVACQVLNQILGAGPASRLFRNIREEKGYSYGVGSGFTALRYMNHFSAGGSVRTEVTGPAIDEFLKEFRDLRENPISKEELERAKRSIVASFALQLESQSYVLRQHLLLREYGLPVDYWDKYPASVMAVTISDVQRVAKAYLPVDNLQLVAVGDAKKIAPVLLKYGPVEQYNTEGKRVVE
jgi:predicted Zn-dependent peptidase